MVVALEGEDEYVVTGDINWENQIVERDVKGGSSCWSEDVNLLRVLLAKTWARVGLDSTPRRGLLCFRRSLIFSLNKWTFTKVCHVLKQNLFSYAP